MEEAHQAQSPTPEQFYEPQTRHDTPTGLVPTMQPTDYSKIRIFSSVVLALIVIGTGAYFFYNQSATSPTENQTSQNLPTPTPDPTANWKTYQFSKYPFSFQYSQSLILTEKKGYSDRSYIELSENGSVLRISPEVPGLGFENPDLVFATEPLSINNKQLILSQKPINKQKIYNKKENTTSYLIVIQFSDKRDYSIMVNYEFKNGIVDEKTNMLFDQILSTFKFTDSTNAVACTMDAKMCPDGSYVGRSGPKCEFVCPTK